MARRRSFPLLIALLAALAVSSFTNLGAAQRPAGRQDPEERSELAYLQGLASFQRAVREDDQSRARQHFQEAAGHFERALQEPRTYYMALFYLGVTYGKLERYDEAIPRLQQTVRRLEQDPISRLGIVAAYQDLAVALYRIGRYGEALAELEKGLELDGSRSNLHFYAGLCQFRLGRHAPAVDSLRTAIALDAAVEPRAQFYTGLSQLRRERIKEALEALKVASSSLADPELVRASQEVAQEIRRLRPAADPRGSKPWEVRLSVGMRADSNVILQAEEGPTFGPILEDGDIALFFAAGAGYDLWKSERGELSADYDFHQTLQQDISDFDLQAHYPRLRGAWTPGGVTLGVSVGAPLYRLGGEDYLQRVYTQPFFGFYTAPWAFTHVAYLVADQNFKVDFFDPARDGIFQEVGVRQYFLLSRYDRYLYAGYEYHREDPDTPAGNDFEYTGHQFEAGFQTPIHGDATVQVGYLFSDDDYRFRQSLDPANRFRRDQLHEIRLGLRAPLARRLELQVDYLGRINDSTIPDFQYRRHAGSVALQFVF